MKSRYMFVLATMVATLILVGCGAGQTATPGEFPSGEGCDEGPEGTIPMINQDHGYCLRYLDGFEESYPNKDEAVLSGPVPSTGTQAQVFIMVSNAEGKTAQQIADGIMAEAQVINPNVTQSNITFAGEPAVMLDGVPGQDFSRQVIVVSGERAYQLSFVPWDETAASFSQLEKLYNTILTTFEFHP